MSYRELLSRAFKLGMNCADIALADMMDIVAEENGVYPKWSDKAPDWILCNFGIKEVENE